MTRLRLVAIPARLALSCLALSCLALGSPATAETGSEKATGAFGDDNPACLQWTDGCVICKRGPDDDGPACSTAGAACVPTEPKCSDAPR